MALRSAKSSRKLFFPISVVSRFEWGSRFKPWEIRLTCPSCSSTRSKKVSLVYWESLTRHDGHWGVCQSGISKIAAPPKKISYLKVTILWILLCMAFVAVIEHFRGSVLYFRGSGDDIILVALFIAPLIAIVALTFLYNRFTYSERAREWDRHFMCQECGVIFVP